MIHLRYPYSDRMVCGRVFPTARVPWVSTADMLSDRITCGNCRRVLHARDAGFVIEACAWGEVSAHAAPDRAALLDVLGINRLV